MNSLLGTVTSVAGQVTSTVREMATEVMDTEREIRHERQQSQHQEHAVARLAPEAETTAASTSASANGVAVAGLPETNGKPPPLKDAQQQQPSASLASLKARLERERSRASKQHELLDRIRDRRTQPPPTASEPKVLPPPVAAPAPTPQPRPAEAAAAIPPIPPQPQQQQQQQELIDRLERTLLDVKRQTQEREEIWKSLVRDKDAALASLAAKHEAAVNMLHDELKEKVMKRLKTEWEKEKKGMGTSDLDERSFFAPFAWAAGGCVIVTVPSTRKMACSFKSEVS